MARWTTASVVPTSSSWWRRGVTTRPGPRHANLLAVVALVLGVLVVCAPANPAGATVGTSLQAGQTLAAGHSLTSANGQYELIMQSAGNLVIYEAPQAGIRALWWTPTYAAGSYLLMQSDCNLVMYSPSGWEWQSGTSGAGTGCRAVMQDNGSLVVYDSAGAVWSSDSRQQVLYAGQGLSPDQWISSPNGHYRFIMQSAGNAVLYGATTPVWWTPTYTAGSYLLMQSDCNLVMYAPSGWEWQSGTSGDGSSCYLALTNSGALQIFNSSGPVWGVNTTNASLGQAAVRLASGQVGYTSPYADSFCNKFTQYWGDGSACDAANRSQAWCADFVAWVWRQAGVSFTYGDGASDINALASSFYQWGVANGHWHAAGSGYVPQPGDAVIYGLNAAGTYADHVGLVGSYTSGDAGPNTIDGDFWPDGTSVVMALADMTTANGSDSISGYVSF